MDFGEMLRALKKGRCAAREGWNGKGMHIYLEDAASCVFKHPAAGSRERRYAPCIVMFTAQGVHQPGWLASQSDMLATDWVLLHWADMQEN